MNQFNISSTARIIFSWASSTIGFIIQTDENKDTGFNDDQPVKIDENLYNSPYKLGSARTCIEADINHDFSHILYPYDD